MLTNMAKQGESKFKEKVLSDLNSLGDDCVYLKTQERSRRGVLDVWSCIRGKCVIMELKVDGKEATKLQQYNINRARKAGALTFRTNPTLWDYHFQIISNINK